MAAQIYDIYEIAKPDENVIYRRKQSFSDGVNSGNCKLVLLF